MGTTLNYADPSFTNTLVFGKEGQPAGNLVSAPPDPDWRRGSFQKFKRGAHFHRTARLAIVTSGASHFFAHRRIDEDEQDYVIGVPVCKNYLVMWPGGICHTFATQSDTFEILSTTSIHSRDDLEGCGKPASAMGINFDNMPMIGSYELRALMARSY